jgi:retinol dehydrogenase 12
MSKEANNKAIVVTGATSGIGYQAALDLARAGSMVIGVGRDEQRCREAERLILEQVPAAKVIYLTADLGAQAQVRRMAGEIKETLPTLGFSKLDVLVNNAGLVSDRKVITEDGVELTFAVNHLAPFLLTHLLLPVLDAPGSRVLTVSSNSHYHTRFNPLTASNPPFFFILWAYKVSKLSNVLFSVEFNRRNQKGFPRAYAIDPGLVNTGIGKKGTSRLVSAVWGSRQSKGESAEVPARTILHLALEIKAGNDSPVYWRDRQPKQPSRAALDEKLACGLWEESCRLCGISDYFMRG